MQSSRRWIFLSLPRLQMRKQLQRRFDRGRLGISLDLEHGPRQSSSRCCRRQDPVNLESRAARAEALIHMGELSAARQAFEGAAGTRETLTARDASQFCETPFRLTSSMSLQQNSSHWPSTCCPQHQKCKAESQWPIWDGCRTFEVVLELETAAVFRVAQELARAGVFPPRRPCVVAKGLLTALLAVACEAWCVVISFGYWWRGASFNRFRRFGHQGGRGMCGSCLPVSHGSGQLRHDVHQRY